MDEREPTALELRLLLASTKVPTTANDEAAIGQMLNEGIDWTVFAKMAIDRGLVSCAAHTLVRVAPHMMPDDILDVLRKIAAATVSQNGEVFREVARLLAANPVGGTVPAIENARLVANRALVTNPMTPSLLAHLRRLIVGPQAPAGRDRLLQSCYRA